MAAFVPSDMKYRYPKFPLQQEDGMCGYMILPQTKDRQTPSPGPHIHTPRCGFHNSMLQSALTRCMAYNDFIESELSRSTSDHIHDVRYGRLLRALPALFEYT